MLVHRSKLRPLAPPPKCDPYAGEVRKALGEAKARKARVTLAIVRALKEREADRG